MRHARTVPPTTDHQPVRSHSHSVAGASAHTTTYAARNHVGTSATWDAVRSVPVGTPAAVATEAATSQARSSGTTGTRRRLRRARNQAAYGIPRPRAERHERALA